MYTLDPEAAEIEIFSETGSYCSTAEISCQLVPTGFTIDVNSNKSDVKKIVLRWRQQLGSDWKVLGDHWERGYGDLCWRPIELGVLAPWYAVLFQPSTEKAFAAGVATGAASIVSWMFSGEAISLTLDVSNGATGVRLGGRTLRAATVHSASAFEDEALFAFSQRFCRLLCDRPRLPKFPVYGANDWYYAYGNNSADSVIRDAALVRELSPSRTTAPFMVIDAGWFPAQGCAGGPYDRGNERFPDMSGLARQLADMEVQAGVWIRPLLTADAPSSWRLHGKHPIWEMEDGIILDPSVPDVLDLVSRDVARLATWGYGLIKHDFTTYDITGRWGFEMRDGAVTCGKWHFADRSRTTAEIIRELYTTIREAAADAVLIGCNTVGHLGAGLFELQRTGDDTSGREWSRTRKMGVNTLAFRMPQHGAFFAADADCVGLTNDIPWHFNRQWLNILALSGTPLFVSADPAAVGPAQRVALQESFALAATNIEPAEPLDWMQSECPRMWRTGNGVFEFDWDTTADI